MTRKNFFEGLVASAAFGCRWFAFAAPLMRKQKRYDDTTWWDPYVENITDADTYIRRKFRQDVTDKTSGVGAESLKEILAGIIAAGKSSGESWRITKAKLFAAQAEKMSIDVSPETCATRRSIPRSTRTSRCAWRAGTSAGTTSRVRSRTSTSPALRRSAAVCKELVHFGDGEK